MVVPISGIMILCKDSPALFIAVSSKCSPRFPKVMREDNKIASGKAVGIVVSEK